MKAQKEVRTLKIDRNRFSLNPDCFLVKGAKRGALYDLATGNVYSIDENSVEILDKCEKGFDIDQILQMVPQIDVKEMINHLKSLESFGIGKFLDGSQNVEKIALLHPEIKLNFIWLELTKNCNQRCLHCYADSFPGKMEKMTNFLSLEEWKRIIREAYDLGARRLQFTGGEPMLFGKDIFALISLAREVGYNIVEIFTNATLFTDQDIDLLAKYDVWIATNIYSKRAEIHDQITRLKGSFEKTIRNIKKIQERGIKISLATILMKQNEEYREETVEFLQEMGEIFPLKHFDLVRPAGRGKCSNILSEKLSVLSHKRSPIFSEITKEKFIKRKYGHSCWWGNLVVTSEGYIMPCIMTSGVDCGNIKTEPLKDIIHSAKLQKLWGLSKDKIRICQDCEYRYACLDCRPLAMEDGGDLYSRGKNCLYNPYKGKWRRIEEGR